MPSNKKNADQKRSRGRPKKNKTPTVNWDEVDSLLVYGETIELEDGDNETRFPTHREIGERYGVSHSLISQYAKQHNCMLRRRQMEKRVRDMADVKLTEYRSETLAVHQDDLLRAVDKFLVQFEGAISEGRVRVDNPTDYNTMVRLRAFILGDADSRHEMINDISLEDLEEMNKKLEEDWAKSKSHVRGDVIPLPTENEKKRKSKKNN